jgi:hypothetical protein
MSIEASDTTDIDARIQKLERRCRASSLQSLMLAGVLVVLLLTGAAKEKPSAVEGSSFVLKDKRGKARAVLEMLDEGPILRLMDEKGEPRLTLLAANKRATVQMMDGKGRRLLALSTLDDNPRLEMMGEREVVQVRLAVKKDTSAMILGDAQAHPRLVFAAQGDSTIAQFSDRQAPRISFGVDAERTELIFLNAKGKGQLGARVYPKGDAAFTLGDQAGRVRSEWAITKDGPTLTFGDETPKPRTLLGFVAGQGVLKLLDKEGKVIFSKP